ncbi:AP complex, mu/sigma subunit [Phycomyces nitens]|nr:AP complex, mu/sigma subunit [Phycomyces nitens]
MIHFVLIVNRRCQTRFSRYYNKDDIDIPATFELEIARKTVIRKAGQCLFFKHATYTIVYRTYGSLYFVVGCDEQENEFGILECIQAWVEAMDCYFEKVTELDLVFNIEKVHMIMDEIVLKGSLAETNQERVLAPIYALADTR